MNKPSYSKHRLLKSFRNMKKQIKGIRWRFSDPRALIQDEACKGRFGKGIKFGVAVSRIISGSSWKRDLSLPQSFLALYEDERGYLNANLILLSCRSEKYPGLKMASTLHNCALVCPPNKGLLAFLLLVIYIFKKHHSEDAQHITSFSPCQSANEIHFWCPHPVWWSHQWIMDDCWKLLF